MWQNTIKLNHCIAYKIPWGEKSCSPDVTNHDCLVQTEISGGMYLRFFFVFFFQWNWKLSWRKWEILQIMNHFVILISVKIIWIGSFGWSRQIPVHLKLRSAPRMWLLEGTFLHHSYYGLAHGGVLVLAYWRLRSALEITWLDLIVCLSIRQPVNPRTRQQPQQETSPQEPEEPEEILGSDDEEQEDPHDYCKGKSHIFLLRTP